LTDHSQRSTAHLIDPQTLFSLGCGEKADNHKMSLTVMKSKNRVLEKRVVGPNN
jgi:hypothetical protein